MRRKIILTGLMTLLPLGAAFAVDDPGKSSPTARQQAQQQHCNVRTDQINKRVASANSQMEKRDQHEQKAIDHWNKLISRAEAAPSSIPATDASIVKLQTDIAALQSQISQNQADRTAFVQQLQAVATADCGARQQAMADAKTAHTTWEKDWGKPKSIHQAIRQDVVELLKKMQTAKQSAQGAR